jgi:hypothetical protein
VIAENAVLPANGSAIAFLPTVHVVTEKFSGTTPSAKVTILGDRPPANGSSTAPPTLKVAEENAQRHKILPEHKTQRISSLTSLVTCERKQTEHNARRLAA